MRFVEEQMKPPGRSLYNATAEKQSSLLLRREASDRS